MGHPRRRQRLGLLAFAFDGPGRQILDALAERHDLGKALVLCHQVVEGPGDDDGKATLGWLRRRVGGPWEDMLEGLAPKDAGRGFEEAVRFALDQRRWRTEEGGVDLVDLLLIAPAVSRAPLGLSKPTLAALRSLRRRYRLIGRTLLLKEDSFETVGRTGVPGKASPLPFADGGDQGLFDLVVLLDTRNVDGTVVKDAGAATAHAADAIVHLTVGELYETLYEKLQADGARMEGKGRYFSLGVKEWRLRPEQTVAATGDLLYRQAATRLAAGAAPVAAAAASEASLPPDPWLSQLQAGLEAVTPQTEAKAVDELRRQGADSLSELLRENGWSVLVLARLLGERCGRLEELRRRGEHHLAIFMRRFASWYAGKQVLQRPVAIPAAPAAEPEYREEFAQGRFVAFIVSLTLAAGSGVAAFLDVYPMELGIAAGVLALAALFLGLQGFKDRIEIPRPAPPPPPADLMGELQERRARIRATTEILRWSRETATRLDAALADLRKAGDEPVDGEFPLSVEVCSALLAGRSLSDESCLERFWSSRGDAAVAALTEGGRGVSAELRDFADEVCRDFGGIGWRHLFQALGGAESLSEPLWSSALEGARDAAVPRMPVPGLSSYNFLALPRELPEAMKEVLHRQFPEKAVTVDIEGETVVVVRLTQGYEEGRNNP